MRKRLAFVFMIVGTIALAILTAFVILMRNDAAEPLSFLIKTKEAQISVLPYCAEDGTYHVFLPAHCSASNTFVQTAGKVRIDGKTISNGMPFCWDDFEKEYDLSIDGSSHRLRFWKASNVSTMYVNTSSGNMEHIHADKANRETASVMLYRQDGTLDYINSSCSIKGRGNATWQCRKKPYNLSLPCSEDLLGMGEATQWILLANAMDESNLFNYTVLDLAERVGMAWVPECAYVELYLNGEYNGLYLLTEKVESGASKLRIDTSAGEFLARVEPNFREKELDDPIHTQHGRVIDLCEPELSTNESREEIVQKIAWLETAIMSAQDNDISPQIDMVSFAKRYLIDEICANTDADLASSYFYYQDGIFYAGPVWDYDMTFGNQLYNENPHSFMAKNAYRSRVLYTPYDTALLKNEAFSALVKELYQTELLPVIEEMLETDIPQTADRIETAAQMNSIRWQVMFEKNPVTATSVTSMTDYLRRRTDFLTSAWVNGTDYCTLQFELLKGTSYWNISVERGQVLDPADLTLGENFRYLKLDGFDQWNWIDLETGEPFDMDQPVMEDRILVRQTKEP